MLKTILDMERTLVEFSERLASLRKGKGLSQAELAKTAGLHVNQIKRYETGVAQPTFGALKKIAEALAASADELVFGVDARGPDDELRLQFDVVCTKFDADEKNMVKVLLDSLILRHEAKRWGS